MRDPTITVTVPGWKPYNRYHNPIGSGDTLPARFMEISGPSQAFEFEDLGDRQLVKVVDPHNVIVVRLESAQ